MNDESVSTRVGPSPSGERSSASLLVRCWLEPSNDGESPTLRGYVKNLKTGEELFIKDVDGVGQQILRELGTAGDAAATDAGSWNSARGSRTARS